MSAPGDWVVTGNPTEEELAALVVAVLVVAARGADAAPGPVATWEDRWGEPASLLRRPLPQG
ncbi:acyl-CoA carboxylase epsilon subunit [Kineococcus sp. SYSU DK018]|uniref:acyl-CoA carboxylase epsilon subunit n=1 Tax=Kineococcus sp. SYSU DK018 TaxID=3383139 RepID=UPI003D7E3D3C